MDYYLDKFLEGQCDDAFHSLIESDAIIIPELMRAYEGTVDVDTRVFLIDVISEFRLPSSFEFLGHALRRQEPRIWKKALDGLAMVETSASLDTMNAVLSTVTDEQKRAWIIEAVSDIKTALTNQKAEQDVDSNAEI